MYNRHLIDYIPPYEQGFEEVDAILTHAEEPEISSAWDAADNLMNDQFISDATENGVSRWEKLLKMTPKATETLDSRKFTLLTRTSEQPPFTITALEKQLEALCGVGNYDVVRDVDTKVLYVKIGLAVKHNFDDVAVLLERIVPANMVIELTLKYNKHEKFSTYTHESLQSFTHDYLRNGVDE